VRGLTKTNFVAEMRVMSNKKVIQFTASLMLGLFSLVVLNNVLFSHIHIMEDQSIVMHAHPFDNSDNGQDESNNTTGHSHTAAQIIALGNLHVLYSDPFEFHFESFVSTFNNHNVEVKTEIPNSYISRNSGRAPPVLFFS
jgi:hypothetical protein